MKDALLIISDSWNSNPFKWYLIYSSFFLNFLNSCSINLEMLEIRKKNYTNLVHSASSSNLLERWRTDEQRKETNKAKIITDNFTFSLQCIIIFSVFTIFIRLSLSPTTLCFFYNLAHLSKRSIATGLRYTYSFASFYFAFFLNKNNNNVLFFTEFYYLIKFFFFLMHKHLIIYFKSDFVFLFKCYLLY